VILPIVAYGSPVLKKVCEDIDADHEGLQELIDNMFETMYEASGVGLAAPQIGKSIRLFIVDASPFAEDEGLSEEDRTQLTDFKKVFINAEIISEEGEPWGFEEGCLSIPDIREEVMREPEVTLRYSDRDFKEYEETFTGLAARVIQHEYDHIDGVLFTDHLTAFKRRLLKRRLEEISKGRINAKYKMKFPNSKKKRK